MQLQPRGIRLNNPFNLKSNNIFWEGLVKPSSDPVFCQFESPIMGLRAGYINIKMQLKEGFDTVYKLITKYAPNSDHNNTSAYIQAVCKRLDKNADEQLTMYDIKQIGLAIMTQEQGGVYYTDDQINEAIKLAGVTTNADNTSNGNPSFFSWLRGLFVSN